VNKKHNETNLKIGERVIYSMLNRFSLHDIHYITNSKIVNKIQYVKTTKTKKWTNAAWFKNVSDEHFTRIFYSKKD
jgi:hypothetical protein